MLHVIKQYEILWHKEFSSRFSKFPENVTLQSQIREQMSGPEIS